MVPLPEHENRNRLIDRLADLGVSEIWRYDGRNIKFYQLQNGEYTECNFPSIGRCYRLQKLMNLSIALKA